MHCWSCGKKIGDDAKFCPHCEAQAEPEPTKQEIKVVKEMMAQMTPDVLEELQAAFQQSDSGEEFVRSIMIGDCPACGGTETGDCEDDPDVDDICVGRCFACRSLWCCECGQLFPKGQTACSQCLDE